MKKTNTRVNLFYFLNKNNKIKMEEATEQQINHHEQLNSQEFVDQANTREKTFGHNKFQLEIKNYQMQISDLDKQLNEKNLQCNNLNNELNKQKENHVQFEKTFNDVKQTYENRISNLSVQYENVKKQLEQKVQENEQLKSSYKMEYPAMTDLYKQIETLKNDLHEISLNRDFLKEKFDNLTEMYELQNKKLETSTDLCEQLNNELNLQKSISQSLEKELNILKDENINNKNKIEDLQVLLVEKDEELVNKNNINNLKNISIKTTEQSNNESNDKSLPQVTQKRIRLYGSRRRRN
jgi:chromosome segregation ATPase